MNKYLAGKAFVRALLAVLAVAPWCATGAGAADKDAGRACVERMRRDVTFLSSDACEGRGPRTGGLQKAADYVAEEFRKAGLKPVAKGSYFQPFAIPLAEAKVVLGGPAGKRITLAPGKQFLPLGSDQKGKASGEVVFAGYGLSCTDPPYDDYANVDVKGKVVVLLRGRPRSKAAQKSKEMAQQAGMLAKINAAAKRGAVAVLLVNDADAAEGGDPLADYSYTRLSFRQYSHLPAVAVKRSVVQTMLPPGRTLAKIENAIEASRKPDSFPLTGWKVEVEVTVSPRGLTLKNVVGVLEGAGPLAGETVVVGAHYDHLGYGGPSSLDRSGKRAVHHGADDNASGTAALIELARRFAAVPDRQGRRLVFVAFSGEELNLYGSAAYCKEPPYPLRETAAMFNLDMVGRLRNDRLLTEGHGTAQPFKGLIDGLAKKQGFTLSSQASGVGPSDHASFCGKKVPVLFFWTGNHGDYHRPTDTVDRINFDGMRRVVGLSEAVIAELTQMAKPAFVEVKGPVVMRPSGGIPRLGFRPGYGDPREGVLVEAVTAGGPADKGGVKDEDLIVGVAGKEVKDFSSYISAMGRLKPGTTIDVTVLRKGKKVMLKVKLD
jgi:hypothetical protein